MTARPPRGRPGGRGLERDVVVVGVLDRVAGVGGAGFGAVLEVDVDDLKREALFAVLGLIRAWLEAAGEGDGLALDEVLGGGLGLGLPEDEVDVDGVGLAVAAVSGDRDGGYRLA